MPAALVCAFTEDARIGLEESLKRFDYRVESVGSHAEALFKLKSETFDALIAQANPKEFADFLRAAIRLCPTLDVHLFKDKRIFCFYPMNAQSETLIRAICAAPFEFPRGLLRYVKPVKESETVGTLTRRAENLVTQ